MELIAVGARVLLTEWSSGQTGLDGQELRQLKEKDRTGQKGKREKLEQKDDIKGKRLKHTIIDNSWLLPCFQVTIAESISISQLWS